MTARLAVVFAVCAVTPIAFAAALFARARYQAIRQSGLSQAAVRPPLVVRWDSWPPPGRHRRKGLIR